VGGGIRVWQDRIGGEEKGDSEIRMALAPVLLYSAHGSRAFLLSCLAGGKRGEGEEREAPVAMSHRAARVVGGFSTGPAGQSDNHSTHDKVIGWDERTVKRGLLPSHGLTLTCPPSHRTADAWAMEVR
jgi:hypothetical protein